MNACYMQLRSCKLRKRIVVVKNGPCGKCKIAVVCYSESDTPQCLLDFF